ncbi:MAG TPA: hypothetical protein PLK68_01795 [Thomasclavelia ramosa]|nr:hypothetical protein [Thomasclavelia ramosa]
MFEGEIDLADNARYQIEAKKPYFVVESKSFNSINELDFKLKETIDNFLQIKVSVEHLISNGQK